MVQRYHRKTNLWTREKYNDYGLGFYCTDNIELAKEWGTSFERSGYANRYQIDCTELKILDLNDDKYCILHWLAILLSNREFDTPAGLALEAKEFLKKNFMLDYKEYDIIKDIVQMIVISHLHKILSMVRFHIVS